MRGKIEVNLAALRHNWSELNTQAAGECGAVVKADAYGLGVDAVAPALAAEGCRSFFVANLEEGIELRKILGISPEARIIVFAGADRNELEALEEYRLTPVITSLSVLRHIEHYRKRNSFAFADVLLQLDVGMNRYGLSSEEFDQLRERSPETLRKLSPKMLMAHFSCAESPDSELTRAQVRRMQTAHEQLTALGLTNIKTSYANSQALFSLPDVSDDLSRPGIAIYGGYTEGFSGKRQRDVVKVSATVRQIRTLRKGEPVGYGADFIAPHDMPIAIVGLGYADGLPRTPPLQGQQTFFYCGEKALPVVGRVSMDACAVDLGQLSADVSSKLDALTLFETGEQLKRLAESYGTIDYEILTRLSARFRRECS